MENKLYTTHGGDLDAIERAYGIPRGEIIDFSGNINPLGAPVSVQRAIVESVAQVSTYPDRNYAHLREAIGGYVGLEKENVMVGNGSTELISLLIQTLAPKRAVVIAPVYSEYQRELTLAGSEIVLFPLHEREEFKPNLSELLEVLDETIQLLIVCNPNNPTGIGIAADEMGEIANHCRKNRTFVMVDETYAEFAPEGLSAIPLVRTYENLLVIRGTAKFFAVPGLRLGYACGSTDLLRRLEERQNPWTVNILSAIGGAAMFGDAEYIQKTRRLVLAERERMFAELSAMPFFHAYKSAANFVLIKIKPEFTEKLSAGKIAEELLKDKILVRDAASFDFLDERFLRFCVLLPEQNTLLAKKLQEVCNAVFYEV